MKEFSPKRNFCWECGKELPSGTVKCPSCQDSYVVAFSPPSSHLGFCGGQTSVEILLDQQKTDVRMRVCCKCGNEWMCDYNTWIAGPCPHCNATGTGLANDEKNNILPKLNKEIETPFYGSLNNVSHLSENMSEKIIKTMPVLKFSPSERPDFKKWANNPELP